VLTFEVVLIKTGHCTPHEAQQSTEAHNNATASELVGPRAGREKHNTQQNRGEREREREKKTSER
jgi:hypothetical protein